MNDSRQRIIVDKIAFGQAFAFHRVLRSVTQAMQPPRLLVGLLMVMSLVAVGKLCDAFDEPTIPPSGLLSDADAFDVVRANELLAPIAEASDTYKRSVEERRKRRTSSDEDAPPSPVESGNIDPYLLKTSVADEYRRQRRRMVEESELPADVLGERDQEFFAKIETIEQNTPRYAFEATAQVVSSRFGSIVKGVFTLNLSEVFVAFYDILIRTPIALWDIKPWFFGIYGLFSLLVISIGGGALCRMSVCEIAGRERLRAIDGFNFATRHWIRLVLAPLLPLLIAGALISLLMVGGVALFWVPYIDILGGLLYFVNLIIGFATAFVLLAYFAGFPMVLPAVATECADPADALQRAIAYLLTRPLHFAGYAVVGLAGLAIGFFVVSLVTVTTINIAAEATSALGPAADNPALSIGGGVSVFDLTANRGEIQYYFHQQASAFFVSFWQGLVLMLVAAYVVSYIFTCSSHIYMLMRKTVDDQDYGDIWRPGLVPGTLAPMPEPVRPFPPAAADDEPTPVDDEGEEVDDG